MGADMAITALALRSGQQLDWAAAEAAINDIPPDTLTWIAENYRYDEADVVQWLREAVVGTRRAIRNRDRECDSFRFGEWTIYATGGMNRGESPTELFDCFALLRASGVDKRIGFSWPPDEPNLANACLAETTTPKPDASASTTPQERSS